MLIDLNRKTCFGYILSLEFYSLIIFILILSQKLKYMYVFHYTELGLKFYASDRAICVYEWGWSETQADND